MSAAWDGLLLLDKPSGPTSHDLVDHVRRATRERRVGHAGTLDPLASGLLPLVLGRATRLVRFLPASPKVYEGTLLLGLTTRTDDVTGDVVARHAGELPPAERVLAAAAALTGERLQRPPAVSARKVGGRRLYRLAYQGVAVDVEPRAVSIQCFELTQVPGDAARFGFVAEVSGGTYVRALVRDLGQDLGCGAALAALRRTRIGPMRPSPEPRLDPREPLDLDRLRSALVALEDMPLVPPPVRLGEAAAARFVAGAAARAEDGGLPDGECCVFDVRGRLIGVGEQLGGVVKPRVVLDRSPV